MASEGGSDPSEDVAKLFAVTESLVGAGIAPAIHLGRGITIVELGKSTVSATIETSEDEEGYVFEILKGELWRAVKLLEELDGGPEAPSAAVSRDTKGRRSKMAEMFLTTEMPSIGRSVKSVEQLEDEESESLLNDLHAAAGDGGAPAAPSRDRLSDDPVFLLQAFVPPQMTQ